jgi:hypothetical protein
MLSSKSSKYPNHFRIRDIRFVFVFQKIRPYSHSRNVVKGVIRIQFQVNSISFHLYWHQRLCSYPSISFSPIRGWLLEPSVGGLPEKFG